jgi:hypothetical protein
MSVHPATGGGGEPAIPAPTPGPPASASEPTNPPGGLSEFFHKVLDQLSLSAWLPATMFVGCAALLLQLAADASIDVTAAILALANKPFGIIVVLLFSLILSAIGIQAFSFEVIRFLEGYWGSTRVGATLATILIFNQARKLKRLRRRHKRQQLTAFQRARDNMLSVGLDRTVVDVLEDDIFERKGRHTPEEKAIARSIGWRRFSTAQRLARLDRLIARLEEYPDDHRLLPTRLGNVLRSAEDRLELPDGDLEGVVMRRYDQLAPRLQLHHDQFRTRLDMYCILVFVSVSLAILSILVVARTNGALISLLYPASFLTLAAASYSASITSARGYGATLRAIQRGPA